MMAGFIARHGLWADDQARLAQDVQARVQADGLTQIRLSFPDLHGLLRGKTLLPDALPGALRDGCAITSTLLFKDTSHHTVVPIFSAGAGVGDPAFQGGADIIMVPDPATFRILPWAPGTAWMLCDLYHCDGRALEIAPRHIARDAVAKLESRGFDFISGLEIEFHLTRLVDPRLDPGDAGQPGSPPEVALLHQGYAYLTEQRFDRIEPILDILRRDCQALELPLHSLEIEFGPSQVEFVMRPGKGLAPADDMIVFRNAIKQIARRHGYHASFMCRPQLPGAMSSGWHLHQSLAERRTENNAFAPADEAAGLSQTGRHYLAGLLDGAVAATPFTTPTINGYKRYRAHSLAPDRVAWAADNRGALLRVLGNGVPASRRIENRIGEPAANPYLYVASQILTGLAGIDKRRNPPPPVDAPYHVQAEALPTSLETALECLDRSTLLRTAFGNAFVDYFLMIKRAEVARYNATVTDWEQREYFDLF